VLNQLRQQHFPPRRNFLSAHITLFHALPAEQETLVRDTLTEVCQRTPTIPLHFNSLRFLGRGVAIEVDSPPLLALRRELAAAWQDFLTPQDRQGYRPHVTIQNKVTPDMARHLFEGLSSTWEPFEGHSEALLLWRYRGGPWEAAGEFGFEQTRSKIGAPIIS
jgi:2'-5' RNA ligase